MYDHGKGWTADHDHAEFQTSTCAHLDLCVYCDFQSNGLCRS